MENEINITKDFVVVQVDAKPIASIRPELKEMKKVNCAIGANHNCSSNMKFGSNIKKVCINIQGKVQGVFYRKWTVQTANKLGLHGWVRNLHDGTVEAVFSGKSRTVESMVEKCKEGPRGARVTAVDVSPYSKVVFEGFKQMPTI